MSEDKQKVILYMKEKDGSFWLIKEYFPATCQYVSIKIDEINLWDENGYVEVGLYIKKLERKIDYLKEKIKLISEPSRFDYHSLNILMKSLSNETDDRCSPRIVADKD